MAFKKTENENQNVLHNFSTLGEKNMGPVPEIKKTTINVPMVFVKKIENGEKYYHGFVPGIMMKNIISKSLEDCQQKLLPLIQEKLKTKIQLKSTLPYFPTNEEIVKDFDNVVCIKRFKITYRPY